MSVKRKRGSATSLETAARNPTPPAFNKPISAIAAARLKIEAQLKAQQLSAVDGAQEAPPDPPMEEATSDYAESEFEEEYPITTLIPKNFKLCNWPNISANILSNTPEELTINLDKHQTVSFIGRFDVKVLKGAVNINGANIGAVPRQEEEKNWRVYVPSTHPVTKIRGLDRVNHVQFVSCKEPVPLSDISPLFAGIWAAKKDMGRSFDFISESDADIFKRPLVPENAPEDWLHTIEEISNSPSTSTLIIGPSQTGKSTLAKRLLNRYLTGLGKNAKAVPSVCYLELDPSQPEYTPHGQISLTVVREVNLGPSFTHPATVPGKGRKNETIAAHPLPMNDLGNHEEYFTSCITSLFQTYKTFSFSEDATPPLIINTPPSLYTTHFPLLTSALTTILKPKHIIHLGNTSSIDTDSAEKLHTLTLLATTKTNSQIHELGAQTPILATAPQRTEDELRSMSMQSYFHLKSIKSGSREAVKWNGQPVETSTPWEFCYESTQTRTQDFIGFLPLFEPLPASQLATALNGSIIHIVQTSDAEVQSHFASRSLPRTPKWRLPYFESSKETGLVAPLDPQSSKLVCTALLHSFDPENRVVNVLVPRTHDTLLLSLEPETTVLVAGCCDTPEWAYVEGGKGPWVEQSSTLEGMGYLNATRRVRKFLG